MTHMTTGNPYGGPVTVALPKPSMGDVTLTATLVALGQLTTWLQLDSPDAFAGSRPVNAVVLAVGTLPILWRRFAPTAVVAVSAAVLCLPHTVADLDVTVLGQFVPLVVVTASCGYHASARKALLGAVFAVAGMLGVSWTTPFLRTPTSFVFNLLVLLAPWAAARALRHREDRARRLGAALANERTHFEGRMAEAVERERAEIARDLHDIVAHGVSVMVVQIGGARMQLAENPDRATQSLLHAEDAGRQALADLRRMLGVLRDHPATTPTDAQPRPGLGHLDALIQQTANSGLQVQARTTGRLDRLPSAVDISAYRIVQEALTNVLKHSGADHAHLRIEVTDTLLSIDVRDDGRQCAHHDHQGHGLVGIRERVTFFGGSARIGPAESGGWEVAVAIPLSGSSQPAPVTERTHT
jgi:signal transduction histidine kinase